MNVSNWLKIASLLVLSFLLVQCKKNINKSDLYEFCFMKFEYADNETSTFLGKDSISRFLDNFKETGLYIYGANTIIVFYDCDTAEVYRVRTDGNILGPVGATFYKKKGR